MKVELLIDDRLTPVTDQVFRILEYQAVEIRVSVPRTSSETPRLELDGFPVGEPTVRLDGEYLRFCWTYRSESWCGRATLTAHGGDRTSQIQLLSAPSGSKYREDEYERLLERVLGYHRDFLFGLAPGETEARERAERSISVLHPVVLEVYLGDLLRQLRHILDGPVLATRHDLSFQPFSFSRPSHAATVAWLGRHPLQAERIRAGDVQVRAPAHRREESPDHPANRYVAGRIRQILRRLAVTAEQLERHSRRALVDPPERAKARSFARRAASAAEQLTQAIGHPTLRGLPAGELTESATQIFYDHPAYARFARLSRKLLDAGVEVAPGDLSAAMRRSFDLFEIYCLYRLREQLEATLGDGWRFHRAEPRSTVLCCPAEGVFWTAKHPDGREWRLLYQQAFARSGSGGFTLTSRRVPDFVLLELAGGEVRSWTLLDAKYRSAPQSLHEALASMHVYRDSLLWGDPKGASARPRGGYLLVPAVHPDMERYRSDAFLDRWGLGLVLIDDERLAPRLLQPRDVVASPPPS